MIACSVHHQLGFLPVELLARHWQYSSHALEDSVFQTFFKDFFNGVLVRCLGILDGFDNVGAVSSGDWDGSEIFTKVKLDVSFLEVVVVDVNMAVDGVIRGVHDPLCLPLTSPAGF